MYSVGGSWFIEEVSLTLRDEAWLFVSSQFGWVNVCTSVRVLLQPVLQLPAATSSTITTVGRSVGPLQGSKPLDTAISG